MTNLVTDVAEMVESVPDSAAIAHDGSETTYETFWNRAGRFAAALDERGIGADDRVAIYLPNLPQFVTAFYGTLRVGGVVVPMNPQYKAREIGHLLRDSGARAVVTLAANVPAIEEVRGETGVEHVVGVGDARESATAFESFLADETVGTVERADDDVAAQPYTSGTTGTPKGVLLTHRNLAWTSRTNAEFIGGIEVEDDLIGTLPLFHIYGMSVVMNGSLYNGATYHPVTEWDAREVLELIESEEITVMFGVPAMFNDVINRPDAADYDLSSLRFVNSGGSSLPMEVLERFEELFGVELNEGYGLTETSPVTHANRPGERRKGSIGKPLPGVDARIVDSAERSRSRDDAVSRDDENRDGRFSNRSADRSGGDEPSEDEGFEEVPRVEEGPIREDEYEIHEITGELVVAGPNVMKGYYGLPEANEEAFTEADGKRWFHTGDVGYRDEDDFFFVVDREKHVIVTGGYNVYPREVEELLFEHEDVADAAVVGVPDDRRGETVTALVVPTPDAAATPEEIKQYCLERLAEYKHPREVEFVEELPRTTTGKVQKFKLGEEEE